jgi:phosphoadenosine phosphosulfate reductase
MTKHYELEIEEINKTLTNASLDEVMQYVSRVFKDDAILASSLGLEDQVLSHAFLSVNAKARIFVLDTGRLHQETYDVMSETKNKYSFDYEVFFPKHDAVQNLLSKKGPNSFYDSVENRKECCHIRKVEPLSRALKGVTCWMTGLRRDQSSFRVDTQFVIYDEVHHAIKLNPLINWSDDDVWAYIKEHKVPYNVLHDKGFPSIGCAPCTRAIEPGEQSRAGRWWWESSDQKECGLHVVDGKLVRKKISEKIEEKQGNNDGSFG